ncbi:MAG TPA: CPBP family glutamic-type intramembrane protease [Gemmatimonadales bacterium]|nr:CPBP family glutamic-type intramembrane protease [Gemmatimonadales bacterium]
MTVSEGLLKKYPVRTFFALTLAISWSGLLVVGGAGFFAGSSWETDPRFLPAIQTMLLGPPVAGVLCTILFSGTRGLRELLRRLLRWRVRGRWYAVALFGAPLIQGSVLMALSLSAPSYLPPIITSSERVDLLLPAIGYGIAGGFMEELGWTGFAIPRLRVRFNVLTTGVIVGVVWGVWHILQMWWVGSTSFGGVAPGVFLPVYVSTAIAALTAYRVLMVWVYDHTVSLFVAVLMHGSYIACTLFLLAPPTTGMPFIVYSTVFVTVLWIAVVVVARTSGLGGPVRSSEP